MSRSLHSSRDKSSIGTRDAQPSASASDTAPLAHMSADSPLPVASSKIVHRSTAKPQVTEPTTSDASLRPDSEQKSATAQRHGMLATSRDALWKTAWVKFSTDQPQAAVAYEALVKEMSGLPQSDDLRSPSSVTDVVEAQRSRLESKQWTYTWFGKPHKVRDNVESVLQLVQHASGLISAGMALAPPYVSIPWSMVAILIPFTTADTASMVQATDGLKEVAGIMAKYSFAEQEYLASEVTSADFVKAVTELYSTILEYQASAAVYFAKSTLRRFARSAFRQQPWSDVLAHVRRCDNASRVAMQAFGTRLVQHGLRDVQFVLQQGLKLLEDVQIAVAAARTKRGQVMSWISSIDPYEDHFRVRKELGDRYLGSGQWLLSDQETYLPWKESVDNVLLLQGLVGSGKSSLVSVVIESLISTTDEQVAFVYCSANSSSEDREGTIRNDTTNILRCILAQLAVCRDGSIVQPVSDDWDHSERRGPGASALTSNATVAKLGEVLSARCDEQMTIIVDALDECADWDSLLESLQEVKQAAPKLRLFLSARFGVDISFAFPSSDKIKIGSSNSEDVKIYVEEEVTRRLPGSGMRPEQAMRLKNALTAYTQGIFRWVVLELNIFLPVSQRQGRKQLSRDIESKLTSLETSNALPVERLLDAYDQLFKFAIGTEQEQFRKQLVTSAVRWVLCSFRPLSIEELSQAVSVMPDGTIEDGLTGPDLLDYCSNFFVADESGVVRLAHLSVRQFFETRQGALFSVPLQHTQAALTTIWIRKYHARKNHNPDFLKINAPSLMCEASVEEGKLAKEEESSTRYDDGSADNDSTNAGAAREDSIHTSSSSSEASFAMHAAPISATSLAQSTLCSSLVNYSINHWAIHYRLSSRPEELVNELNAMRDSLDQRLDNTLKWIAEASDLRQLHLGSTALQRAVADNDVQRTALLLYADKICAQGELMGTESRSGNTALNTAAQHDHAEVFKILVHAGAKMTSVEEQTAELFNSRAVLAYMAHRKTMIESLSRLNVHDDRPRIKISSTKTRICALCDLERWVEGSRVGTSFLLCSSLLQLQEAADAGCQLCGMAWNKIEDKVPTDFSGTLEIRVQVDLHMDLFGGSQDAIRYFIPGAAAIELEFYIDDHIDDLQIVTVPGDWTAQRLFCGRPVAPSAERRIQSWLDLCRSAHHCSTASRRIVPTRLIDLGPNVKQGHFRLRTRADIPEAECKYVFLSYSWGRSPPLLLTTANVSEFEHGIQLSRLPSLLRDVVSLVQHLGYQYLWVDALCIVQDSHEGWAHEALAMAKYITSSDLVLATAGLQTTDTLFNTRLDSMEHPSYNASLLGQTHQDFELKIRPALPTALDVFQQKIVNRAWRIQEALLPNRVVIISEEQSYWLCDEGIRAQGSAIRGQFPFESFPLFEKGLQNYDSHQRDRQRAILIYWYKLVEMCSTALTTYEPDRLPSISAIAETIGTIIEGEYRAGLWSEDFSSGLLWIAQSESRASRTYTSPTWSWASRQGPCSYGLAYLVFETSRRLDGNPGTAQVTKLFAVRRCFVSTEAPGSVLVGVLEVTGLVKDARTIEKDKLATFEYFFDDADENGLDTWTRLSGIFLLLVAPLAHHPGSPLLWAGLMLQRSRTQDTAYERKGVILGPPCGSDFGGWEKQEIKII